MKLTSLKPIIVSLAIIVVVTTCYKGGEALIEYIESKAKGEIVLRQQEESAAAKQEADALTQKLNIDLGQEVITTTEYFNAIGGRVEDIIAERQANVVELKPDAVPALAKQLTQVQANKPVPLTTHDAGLKELAAAWEAFCHLRPEYKNCLQGTQP